MSGLRVRSLREIVFGRFKGETLDGFDHPFVVVHGSNETGKSTITEFITWMVGGPSGNAKNALRFGEPEEKIGGRLLGELDGEVLEIAAQFPLKKVGQPKDVRTGIIAGVDVGAAAIADRLRKLSPEDYAFIYRFIGPSIHDTDGDDAFASVLSRFAIGAAASDINPREVAKKISDEEKSLTSAIGKIETEIRKANTQLKESKNRPQELSNLEKQIAQLDQDLETLRNRLQEIARGISFMDAAINAFDANEELLAARKAREETPQIPTEWTDAVANAVHVRQVAGSIRTATEAVETASVKAQQHAQVVGVPASELAKATFTNVERSSVREAGNALGAAIKQRASAEEVIRRGAENIRSKAAEVADAAAQLNVEVSALDGIIAVQGKLSDVNTAAITWRHADATARSKSTDAAKAKSAAVTAATNLRLLEDAELSGEIQTKKPAIGLLVGLAALAGAGAFVHPGISAVFAVALVAVLARTFKNASRSSGIVESAELVNARTEAMVLAQQANHASDVAEQSALDAKHCQDDFEKLLLPFGVALPTADYALNTYQLLTNAASALTSLSTAKAELAAAEENLQGLIAAEESAARTFEDTCSRVGVTFAGSIDALDEWLGAYQTAVQSCHEEVLKRTALNEENRKLLGLLGNVPASVANYPLERILDELDQLEKINQKYRSVLDREGSATIAANAAGGDREGVKEILDQVQTKAEIQSMRSLAVAEQKVISGEMEVKLEDRGALNNKCQEIENVEEINELNLAVSELEDERDELVARRDAQALAAATLLEVIDKFEKENQAPLVKRANELLNAVAPGYGDLIYSHSGSGPIIERDGAGGRLNSSKLSTGSRALVYLALRLAFVEADNDQRGISLPVLCDDPLVHIDDERAPEVMRFLAQASQTRQVILFTCHEGTRDVAVQAGAHVVAMPSA